MIRRAALTAGLGLLFLGLLAHRLQTVEPGQVLQAMGQVGPLPWALAALATWVSFRAVAGYDLTLHRHLVTGVAPSRARLAGLAAIAIAQTVGMGVVSGALVRWRMMPELGLWGAMRLSIAVALSFLMAWAVLAAVVLLVWPVPALAGLAWLVLGAAFAALVAGLAFRRAWCPNLITVARLLALAAVDCLAAGLALWLLLPGDLAFVAFAPAFLIALGAGLMSGSPAGLGAFEMVLLALLPRVAEPELLAGVVAWRVLYYALPAVVGAGVALWAKDLPARLSDSARPRLPEIAEAGLQAQGVLFAHPAGFVAGRTAHGLVALSAVADLAGFRRAAMDEGRWPVLYKADARQAAQARRAGLAVLPIAREAWLQPQRFRLDLPARAGLRRKLRRAEAAGVTAGVETQADWAELAAVNRAWTAARGAENGFSMGRFDPGYLAGQRVIVARKAGMAVGFASFHNALVKGERIWTLDLLRPDPAAPDGTAQLLVSAAIAAARDCGVTRLSLAAVPIGCPTGPGAADDLTADIRRDGPVAWLGRKFAPGSMAGLGQFKSSFAPGWQRLYIAGPSRLVLGLVGLEILREVQSPPPLANMSCVPGQDAEYGFASGRNPWQRKGDKAA